MKTVKVRQCDHCDKFFDDAAMATHEKEITKGWKKVSIPLSEHEFYVLAKGAHNLDLTFNEYVNLQLKKYMDVMERNHANKKTETENTSSKTNRKSIRGQKEVQTKKR